MFELPALPYAENALEPAMSRATVHTHHRKHHAAYVEKTNKLLAESSIAANSLEEVVRAAYGKQQQALFNNAAQAWNHAFFWKCMAPGGVVRDEALDRELTAAFGAVDRFREDFISRGKDHFASGWLWLVHGAGGKITLLDLHDAQTPIIDDAVTPLLTCDLWEHAYYLDHKQAREKFLETFFDQLIDWRFVRAQLNAARSGKAAWRFPSAKKSAA